MEKWLPTRYLGLVVCLVAGSAAIATWGALPGTRFIAVVCGLLVLVGIADLLQTRSTLRRNYPILAHIRFFFEYVRPMLRQYVVESDNE